VVGHILTLSAFLACILALASAPDEPRSVGAEKPNDAPDEVQAIGKGTTGEKVIARLGQPNRIARQILLGRHIEQWTYADPVARRIELRAIRGQELQVVSVHSLRSKKP